MTQDRRLTVLALASGKFLSVTENMNGIGFWNVISRTVTDTFPMHIVGRVAERVDYRIHIRARVS